MLDEDTSQSDSMYGPGPWATPKLEPRGRACDGEPSCSPAVVGAAPPDPLSSLGHRIHVCSSFVPSSAGFVPTAACTAQGPSAMRGMTFQRSFLKASPSVPVWQNRVHSLWACGLAASRAGCTAK
jgi:hypothetical protein